MEHRNDDGHNHGDMPRWMHILLLALVALFIIAALVALCTEDYGRTGRAKVESVR